MNSVLGRLATAVAIVASLQLAAGGPATAGSQSVDEEQLFLLAFEGVIDPQEAQWLREAEWLREPQWPGGVEGFHEQFILYGFRVHGVDAPRDVLGAGWVMERIADSGWGHPASWAAAADPQLFFVSMARNRPSGTHTFAVTLPDGRRAEATFEHVSLQTD